MVRQCFGPDRSRAFFGEFLLPLFHEGLGNPVPKYVDPDVRKIVGKVPYINGGIFELHALEQHHSIYIEDDVFEQLFDFFDKWRWHLNESPTGSDDEISPDILGFIFEQYVNQKDQGAYYTKPDVTGYMSTSAIIPAVVDRLVAAGLEDPCELLRSSGSDYVHSSLGYGAGQTPDNKQHPASSIKRARSRTQISRCLAKDGATSHTVTKRMRSWSRTCHNLVTGPLTMPSR